jgi:adenine C2-methylase RlmN of 23S rRNA A2503 and tRNA A37
MHIRRSDSGLVTKYIHDDGSETVIKSVSSCGNKLSTNGDRVDVTEIDRNKYSMFVSSSVGCPLKCKFCALTKMAHPYKKLTNTDITSNIKEALQDTFEFDRDVGRKFLKLSYMGEPFW